MPRKPARLTAALLAAVAIVLAGLVLSPKIIEALRPRDPFLACVDAIKDDSGNDGVDASLAGALLKETAHKGDKQGLVLKTTGEHKRVFQALSQRTIRARYQACLGRYGVPAPDLNATITVHDRSGPVKGLTVSETVSGRKCGGPTDHQGQCEMYLPRIDLGADYKFVVFPGYQPVEPARVYRLEDFQSGIAFEVARAEVDCRFHLPQRSDGNRQSGVLAVTAVEGSPIVNGICRTSGDRMTGPDNKPCNAAEIAPGAVVTLYAAGSPESVDTALTWNGATFTKRWDGKPCSGTITLPWPAADRPPRCDRPCEASAASDLERLRGDVVGKRVETARVFLDPAGKVAGCSLPFLCGAIKKVIDAATLHGNVKCCWAKVKWPAS